MMMFKFFISMWEVVLKVFPSIRVAWIFFPLLVILDFLNIIELNRL